MNSRTLFTVLGIFCLFLSPLTSSAAAQADPPLRISFQDGALPDAAYAGTRDTYLTELTPVNVLGAATTLYLDGDRPDEADYGRTESVPLLRWDVSAIPAGSRVRAVELTLNINVRAARTWPVYAVYTPWDEAQAIWLRPGAGQFWGFPGAKDALERGAQVGVFSSAVRGPLTFSLNAAGVALVQQWVRDPSRNLGILIADENPTPSVAGIASREASTVSTRPKLTIDYDPPAALNTAPSTAPLALTTPEDSLLTVTPAGSDADGDPLVARVDTLPLHGQVLRLDDTLVYRPALHYNGPDSFTYLVSDGQAESAPAAVDITVQPLNDLPVPTITADVTSGAAPLTVQFSAAAWDVESTAFTYAWDFADGASAAGASVAHTFTAPGAYPVRLTAVDEEGGVGESTRVIMVQAAGAPSARPNVILFIGDGMGMEQVRAAGLYQNGRAGSLLFEGFPYRATMETRSAQTDNTDSAAAATAMATGVKVNNKVLSLAIPGDGRELYTVLEAARDRGQRTGLITTNNITDATPGGFGAHTTDRENEAEIAADMLTQTRPNVLFGAGAYGMTQSAAAAAGYQVITDKAGLDALDKQNAEYVSGQFGVKPLQYEVNWVEDGRPHLSEMTRAALDILDNDPDGFFLMVEDENTDRGSHLYDLPKVVGDVLELDRAVGVAVDWARTHPNTLIVVLADHETSGLTLLGERGRGSYPAAGWTVYNHTGQDVNVYALGVGAGLVTGRIDNTRIASILQGGTFNHPPAVSAASSSLLMQNTVSQLTAAVNDDGLPLPNTLHYTWEVLDGPGAVTFANPAAASTRAVFRAPGRYTLRLIVTDGDLRASTTLTVDVGWGHFVPFVNQPGG